ncbi:FixH family protein [Noviherbaspirillum galbum]|uniref:FixH family protein n=1 Tax=Noviherbaspirillum galbum TaxID=2709383 RepID=A0A6B3SSQ7_9BURK|nr:FixH family protein [Noviherbaspirillum galbum]NEX62385.1 FixH family protein [Noviherbaspirillum galbum]
MNLHATIASLAVSAALIGCMTPPQDLNLATERPTDKGKYVAAIKPVSAPIVINKMHAWEIKLNDAAGEPVTQARIAVGGGMPQHGHGFPTQPRVTRELERGRYLLEGMKFSMPGWWELKLEIDAKDGNDGITFNVVINPE